jgi:hypothetical protein
MARRTVAQQLVEARGLIARGWIQRAEVFYPDDLNHPSAWCAVGALKTVGANTWAFRRLLRAIDPLSSLDIEEGIVLWNDAPGRTQSEVLALFDRAIAAQRAPLEVA